MLVTIPDLLTQRKSPILTGQVRMACRMRRIWLAWRDIPLQDRVLRDLRGAGNAMRLFGQNLAHPILLAPCADHRLVQPAYDAVLSLRVLNST